MKYVDPDGRETKGFWENVKKSVIPAVNFDFGADYYNASVQAYDEGRYLEGFLLSVDCCCEMAYDAFLVYTVAKFIFGKTLFSAGAGVSKTTAVAGKGAPPTIKKLPEIKAPSVLSKKDVVDVWNKFLGKGQTNINTVTGKIDPDRIFSADGLRSIRYGTHEMLSPINKEHFHFETWTFDAHNNT